MVIRHLREERWKDGRSCQSEKRWKMGVRERESEVDMYTDWKRELVNIVNKDKASVDVIYRLMHSRKFLCLESSLQTLF